jgi:hypothetical protein
MKYKPSVTITKMNPNDKDRISLQNYGFQPSLMELIAQEQFSAHILQ